jgi:hypothetical protein
MNYQNNNIMLNHQLDEDKLNLIKQYINKDNCDSRLINELYWAIKCNEGSQYTKPKYNENFHKQVKIYNPFYKCNIDVDIKLAKLLSGLWKHNIETNNSCQDNVPKGYVWLCFDHNSDFDNFIRIINNYILINITDYDKQDDYLRRIESCGSHFEDCWDYKFVMDTDELDFTVNISVRFPIRDLEFVEKIFT